MGFRRDVYLKRLIVCENKLRYLVNTKFLQV